MTETHGAAHLGGPVDDGGHRWVPVRTEGEFTWWKCQECPGDHQFRAKGIEMPRGDGNDDTVSTCGRCGNYNCVCVRLAPKAAEEVMNGG